MGNSTPIQAFFEQLVALSQHYDQLHATIRNGDPNEIVSLADGLDPRKAQLAEANGAVDWSALTPGPATDELLGYVKQHMGRISEGEKEFVRWAESLAHTPDKPPSFDRTVPEGWSLDRDLLIIVGGGGEALAADAISQGQQHVLVFLGQDDNAKGDGCIIVRSMQELMSEIQLLDGEPPKELVIWAQTGSSLAERYSQDIQTTATYCITQKQSNQLTTDVHGHRWALNSIHNIPNVAKWPTVECMDKPYAGKPLVVVSPGPSLTKNIQTLKTYRNNVVVIAVSHAFSALQAAGITPDFVIALEAQRTSYHFDNCDLDAIQALILSVAVPSELFELGNMPTLVFTANRAESWIFDTIGADAELIGGGSVSCTAFTLARNWGCDPIILIGQDLAYTGGKVYTKLSCDGEATATLSEDGKTLKLGNYSEGCAQVELMGGKRDVAMPYTAFMVDGYYGDKVPTSNAFDFFRRWFENVARDIGGEITVLNCTEGGAYIKGFEHAPLEESLRKYATQPIDVRAPVRRAMETDDRSPRIDALHRKLSDILSNLNTAVDLARQCQRLAKQARRNPAIQSKLGKVEMQLIKTLRPLEFLSLLDQRTIRETSQDEDALQSVEGTIQAAETLYSVIIESAASVKEPLKNALARLEALAATEVAHKS